MANTIPPKGVLNAAARPAAAPVMIIFLLATFGHQTGKTWFTFLKYRSSNLYGWPFPPYGPAAYGHNKAG